MPDTVIPEPCEEYHISEYCSRKDECFKMHLCADFIVGACQGCKLNHDILDSQCEKLLKKAKVDLRRTRRDLCNFLKVKWAVNLDEIKKWKAERKEETKTCYAMFPPVQSITKLRYAHLWIEKMEEKRVHIRHCLLFDFDLGISATQAPRHLCQTEGRDAPSFNTCHYWYSRFRSGDRSLEDRPSGQFLLKENLESGGNKGWNMFEDFIKTENIPKYIFSSYEGDDEEEEEEEGEEQEEKETFNVAIEENFESGGSRERYMWEDLIPTENIPKDIPSSYEGDDEEEEEEEGEEQEGKETFSVAIEDYDAFPVGFNSPVTTSEEEPEKVGFAFLGEGYNGAQGRPSNLRAIVDILHQHQEGKRALKVMKSRRGDRDGAKDEEIPGGEYGEDRQRILREAVGRFRQGIGGQHPEVKLWGGLGSCWGGMADRVFLFARKKTFVVEVDGETSWSLPDDRSISSLPFLSSPFHVSLSTCLVPCTVPGKGFYLFGGRSGDGKRSLSDAAMFLPEVGGGVWLSLPDLPKKMYGAAGTALKDGSFLIIGGRDGRKNKVLKTAYVFDPRKGKRYDPLTDMPEPAVAAAATVWKGTQVIVAGGITGKKRDKASSEVRVFDLRARAWETSSSSPWPCLRTPRWCLGLVKDTQDRVIALGGGKGLATPVRTLEALGEGGWKESRLPHALTGCFLPRDLL
ncbi:unnamed protein product [Darwinula stevensoni]|uniref:Mos1 transposase HTH domain-containing protein n=1 Tax=Darwinula stevensoni TaxID=69355 RepID=A0A7R9FNE2_9CRUS|nr:unnamed protein product [Darwinula stevensoni]CAG0896367.1 unnamed protein product [Darwinula stevensoni]